MFLFVKFKYFRKLGDGLHFKWKGKCSKNFKEIQIGHWRLL